MKPTLRAFFDADDDGTGELWVEVAAYKFAGVSSAWFGLKELVEFGSKLEETYPLSADDPITLQGGFWSKAGPVIEELHVGLSFYSVGALGSVACHVQLGTPLHVEDRPVQQSRLELELITSYEAVCGFARALSAIGRGEAKEAVLECAEG